MLGIDLFCGIGGFHYAAKDNGIDIVFASEIDKYAKEQYKLNHGLEPCGDITKIETKDIPDHDILFAGFPCQAFSITGKRQGFEDTRGTLFFEIARILHHKEPKYFLLENVKGLISHDGGKTLKTIEKTLSELGYYIKMHVLDAKFFGVPQSRKRLFIAGFKDKDEYFQFQFPTESAEDIKCVADILESEVSDKYFIEKENQLNRIIKDLNKKFSAINPDIAITMMARQYANGRGNFININSENPGYYEIGDRIRKLTPRECARLQGFPENYKIECSDNQAYKQFGNSVAIPCVSAIIKEIIRTRKEYIV